MQTKHKMARVVVQHLFIAFILLFLYLFIFILYFYFFNAFIVFLFQLYLNFAT